MSEVGQDYSIDENNAGETEAAEKKKIDPKVFEVPDFLYKFSSTFFKKASKKERKIHKIFGK